MQHLFTPAVLKRFATALPGRAFTTDLSTLSGEERITLANSDPELLSVMQGEAPASTLLSIVTGEWADSVPSIEERQVAANAARIAELEAANPYGRQGFYQQNADGSSNYVEPTPGNLSAALELEALAPERAAALKLMAAPPQADPTAAEQSARAAALAQQRVQSLNHSIGAR